MESISTFITFGLLHVRKKLPTSSNIGYRFALHGLGLSPPITPKSFQEGQCTACSQHFAPLCGTLRGEWDQNSPPLAHGICTEGSDRLTVPAAWFLMIIMTVPVLWLFDTFWPSDFDGETQGHDDTRGAEAKLRKFLKQGAEILCVAALADVQALLGGFSMGLMTGGGFAGGGKRGCEVVDHLTKVYLGFQQGTCEVKVMHNFPS